MRRRPWMIAVLAALACVAVAGGVAVAVAGPRTPATVAQAPAGATDVLGGTAGSTRAADPTTATGGSAPSGQPGGSAAPSGGQGTAPGSPRSPAAAAGGGGPAAQPGAGGTAAQPGAGGTAAQPGAGGTAAQPGGASPPGAVAVAPGAPVGGKSAAPAPGSRVRIPEFQVDGNPMFERLPGAVESGRETIRRLLRQENTCGDGTDGCLEIGVYLTKGESNHPEDLVNCEIEIRPAEGTELPRGGTVRFGVLAPCPQLGAAAPSGPAGPTEPAGTGPTSRPAGPSAEDGPAGAPASGEPTGG